MTNVNLCLVVISVLVVIGVCLMIARSGESYGACCGNNPHLNVAKPIYPIKKLPTDLGGFGSPVRGLNDPQQLEMLENAVWCDTYGDDSIANIKQSALHLTKINNIM